MKRILRMMLLIMLVFSFAGCGKADVSNETESMKYEPGKIENESADEGSEDKSLEISSNIQGADIYINDVFSGKTTPAQVSVEDNSSITVSLPGYCISSQTNKDDELHFELAPELYPEGSKVSNIIVTSEQSTNSKLTAAEMAAGTQKPISLDDAVHAVLEDASDTWYVITFADDIETIKIGTDFETSRININKRGKLTIDGGGKVRLTRWGHYFSAINILTSDVRIIGLQFDANVEESYLEYGALQLRVPEDSDEKIDVNNVYVTDCTFTDCFEVGIVVMGDRGHSSTEYGGKGTTNFNNIVFAGNTFIRTPIFSFAGGADECYNVIDGYIIAGNIFEDSKCSFMAGDGNTWYCFDYDGEDSPAYANYNVIRNVTISGNIFNLTENTKHPNDDFLSVECADLGNQGNLVENVEIRNNESHFIGILGITSNGNRSIYIGTAGCSDGYDGREYDAYITDGMEHTDDNIIRNVTIHDNNFELGKDRCMVLCSVAASIGKQCAANNLLTDVQIYHNEFSNSPGIVVTDYYGNGEAGLCENNCISDISIENNKITGNDWTAITVSGSYLFERLWNDTDEVNKNPDYSGKISNITVSDNTIEGYKTDIQVTENAGELKINIEMDVAQ